MENSRAFDWLFSLPAIRQASGPTVFQNLSVLPPPLPPSQDPWYKAPISFETAQPGTILRIRPTSGNLTTVVGNTSVAYNILYRTTDSRAQPSWAVTTLFIPTSFHVSPSGNAALLSYQFAYNTANLDSSPSYGLHTGPSQANADLGIQSDISFLAELLGQGWILNVPDFEGPSAAFGASVLAGQATLDSVRAVLNLARMSGTANITTALWGYSGGSIATKAAAELQRQYAPELKLSGVVLGGQVDSVSGNMSRVNQSPIAVSVVAGLVGLSSQYPEAEEYIRSRLRPETAKEFLSIRDINSSDALRLFAMKDIYSYFIGGQADLEAPPLQNMFEAEARRYGNTVPTAPLFIYKAIADHFCPIGPTDDMVKRLGDLGADITFERNTVGGHVAEIENGKGRAIQWLRKVFDESYVPSPSGCSIRDVTVKISPLDV